MPITLHAYTIFVKGVIRHPDFCDQWRVEPGKQLASHIRPELHVDALTAGHDVSTHALINYYRRMSYPRTDL